MGRRLDSYKFRIAESELDFEKLEEFRGKWRRHVTSMNKRDRELRDAINWDSVPPARHTIGATGEVPYSAGWALHGTANYLDLCYWKSRDDMVFIAGLCKKTGVGATIFVLPEGYRPIDGHIFICEAGNALFSFFGRVDVLKDGQVYYQGGGNPATRLSLSGISFIAEEI